MHPSFIFMESDLLLTSFPRGRWKCPTGNNKGDFTQYHNPFVSGTTHRQIVGHDFQLACWQKACGKNDAAKDSKVLKPFVRLYRNIFL